MQKIMLVTGASRGIGAETARLAAQAGYAVCINFHHSESEANELLDSLLALGATAIAVRADISDESDVGRLFEAIDSQLGRLTALVNNAGITRDNLLMRMKNDEWDDVIATNLSGEFELGPNAVGAGDQQRVAIARLGEVEKPAESTDRGLGTSARGRPCERLDRFDQTGASGDVDASLFVCNADNGPLALGANVRYSAALRSEDT